MGLNPKIQEIENSLNQIANGDREKGITDLGKGLSDFLKKDISVKVIPTKKTKQFFAMCIIPSVSTIDKIISLIANNKGTISAISSLWKKTNNWTVEIDEKLLSGNFSVRELTAIALHECGHVIQTNSIPNRISTIIQLQIAEASTSDSTSLRSKAFSKFLSIPIVHVCTCGDGDSIKKELKADKFAAKCGYGNELISAINKLNNYAGSSLSTKDSLSKSVSMTLSMSSALQEREAKLVRYQTAKLMDRLPMNFMRESVMDVAQTLRLPDEKVYDLRECTIDWGNEKEDVTSFIYTEFLSIGKKKLKPILPREIDYIEAKSADMRSADDKLMMLSYTTSKLELCRYYLDIYAHPEVAKNYIIPNTKMQLIQFEKELSMLKKLIIFTPIKKPNDFEVYYPDKYEG